MSLLPKAAALALAAVALAPAAAHAQTQVPHTLSVAWQPTAPTILDDVTFKATTSAPDVSWDWDGDGVTDASGAQQTHRFTAAGDYRVIVKATWPGTVPQVKQEVESIHVETGIATPTPTPTAAPVVIPTTTELAPVVTPAPTPPPCKSIIAVLKFRASSMICFDESSIPGGKRYTSKYPVNVNNVWLLPQGGKPITIDVTSKIAVNSENAKVSFTTHGSKVEVTKGAVKWTVNGDKLDGFQFAFAAHPAIGGMRIAASSGSPQLLDRRRPAPARLLRAPGAVRRRDLERAGERRPRRRRGLGERRLHVQGRPGRPSGPAADQPGGQLPGRDAVEHRRERRAAAADPAQAQRRHRRQQRRLRVALRQRELRRRAAPSTARSR